MEINGSEKYVLDPCCGGRMFYFDKNDSRVLFCDKRNMKTTLCDGYEFEIRPDIQCNFTELPFPNETFWHIVFDPPHLTRNTGQSKFAQIYGTLNEAKGDPIINEKYGTLPEDWRNMIKKGFSECFRVLKPYGTLIFKWNELDIKTKEVLALTTEKPLYGHISGKKSKTHWIAFLKTPK
jgi:ubiquinone/menaquinone biosynthesis C-methylase UbiE